MTSPVPPPGPAAWLAEQFNRSRRDAGILHKYWRGAGYPGLQTNPSQRRLKNPLNEEFGSSGKLTRKTRSKMPYGVLEQGQQGENPLGPLYEQLLGMLTGDAGSGTADIRGQIDPVYDARVGAIRSLMDRQQSQTSADRVDVEQMYDLLGEDYEQLAVSQEANAEEAQAEVENIYTQLKADQEGNYTRVQQEQADLFSQLGIQDAAPEVLGEQAAMQQSAMGRADELGAINEQRYQDIANIDQTYYAEGQPLARLQGNNASRDLLTQLNSFMSDRSSDIAMVEAERSAAYNQLLAQQQNQAQGQTQWQAEMLWNILQSQSQPQSGEITPEGFLSMLPPELGQQVGTAFRALESDPNIVMGRVEDSRNPVPGTFVPTTDEYWLNAATQMMDSGQIDPVTYEYLMQFLRLYLQGG